MNDFSFPVSRAQRRYERIASSMIQILAELPEHKLIELYEIALNMERDKHIDENRMHADSVARAHDYPHTGRTEE